MNKGSILVDLRPNRLLLDPSFGGYKLSLDSIPIYRKPIETGVKVVQPNEDQFSFYHVKLFSLHNHLYVNHFKPDSVYFTDKCGKIFKVTSSPPSLLIEEVYHMPNIQQHSGNYNISVIFPTSLNVVISDGSGGIYFAEISEQNGQEIWLGEKFELYKEEANCLLTDVKIDEEQILHILLLHIEEKEEKDAKSGLFQTKLKWRTFTKKGNTWEKKYLRELCVDGSVDYVALEPGCKSLYVISDRSPKWVYDSANPVMEKEQEEKPTQPKLYTWTQTQDEVTIWLPLSENINKTDAEISVTDLHIEVKIKDRAVISGDFFHRVDKDLTVWNYEKDTLEVQLAKGESGLMWKTLIPGDETGEEISDPELVKNIHEKLAHLCSDKEETGTTPSFNTQQLEECDAVSCDTTSLVRINGETHAITHEVSLSSLQWLFKVFCYPTETPAVCIRHDVDACVWQFKRGDDENTWPHEHIGTFFAFGYVQASKTQKKFIASPPNLSYVVLCEASHHIYIYRQPSLLASELKNRKTGKKVDTISKQQLVNLEANQQILGIHATNNLLYVLLENSICVLNIFNN